MRDWKKMGGVTLYYFTLRTLFSLIIYIIWVQFDNTYKKSGWDLFFALFIILFFSSILARIISYLIIFSITRQTKRTIPGLYDLNFRNNVNNISLVSIFAMFLSAMIYAWGINWLVLDVIFPEITIITYFVTYIIIKSVTYLISWVFFKIF